VASTVDLGGVLVALAGLIVSIGGLVGFLVRAGEKRQKEWLDKLEQRQRESDTRQKEITDRYFQHLESREVMAQESNRMYGDLIGRMQSSLDGHTENLRLMNLQLQATADGIKKILEFTSQDKRQCEAKSLAQLVKQKVTE